MMIMIPIWQLSSMEPFARQSRFWTIDAIAAFFEAVVVDLALHHANSPSLSVVWAQFGREVAHALRPKAVLRL